jgi:hypothetical protein
MSTTSDWWLDWAIWGAVAVPFIVALFVIVGRIRRGMRDPDEPVDPDRPELL